MHFHYIFLSHSPLPIKFFPPVLLPSGISSPPLSDVLIPQPPIPSLLLLLLAVLSHLILEKYHGKLVHSAPTVRKKTTKTTQSQVSTSSAGNMLRNVNSLPGREHHPSSSCRAQLDASALEMELRPIRGSLVVWPVAIYTYI